MENEKICKYRETLTENLKKLKEERQEILKKVEDGKTLSIKENIRNKKLAQQIKDVQEKLEVFNNLDLYEEMSKDLDTISNEKTTKKVKTEKINKLLKLFKELNETNKNDFLNETNLTEEDLKDLDKVKEDTKKELEDLRIELRLAKRRNYSTEDIEKDIENANELINKIDDYQENNFDIKLVEQDLNKLASKDTTKDDKTVIMIKYNSIINEAKENLLNEIADTMEEEIIDEKVIDADVEEVDNNKKSLKESTKEKLNTVGNFFSRNRKKIIAIGSTAVLCVTIALVAKSCSKDIENSKNNDDLDNKTNIEQTYENANKEVIEALVNKGYSEYAAMLMAENFNDTTLKALQNVPYIEEVENYVTDKEFNLDYLNDYENARNTYNLTSDKAVDYVNRSVKIQETGFYDEASINEIVEIVMAIDNKNLFMQENANLAQSFNTSFNRIVDNYLFGTTTEEDLTKLDALQYFAKEGSDLDLFLTDFGSLAKENIANPNDLNTRNKMCTFMTVFALSVNGYTNTDEDINISKIYNSNAQLDDYFDWYMAYNSFIAPLYPTLIDENEFEYYEELQNIMLTALQDPQFEMVCGEEKSLGGR